MRPQGSLNHKGPYSPPKPPLKHRACHPPTTSTASPTKTHASRKRITLLSSFTPFIPQNTVPYPPHKYPVQNPLQHTPLRLIHPNHFQVSRAPTSTTASASIPSRQAITKAAPFQDVTPHHPPQPNIFQYHKPPSPRYHASPVRYFLHSLVQSQYAKLFLISPHLQ